MEVGSLDRGSPANALRGSEQVSGGAAKDAKRCHGHWDKVSCSYSRNCIAAHIRSAIAQLKADCLVVQRLRKMSGWSWDEARHRVIVPDDVWEAHIAVRCNLSALISLS